jgi:hypothetical protein
MYRLLLALLAVIAQAAEICPHDAKTSEWNSWTAKVGRRQCVANAVSANTAVAWPAAGIADAKVAGRVEFQLCCFESVARKPAPLRTGVGESSATTWQESSAGDEDDFPDLIEDDARTKRISFRGTLGDAEHPARVDVQLQCSASKFADQYALQFTVINRSPDPVEIVWDHLHDLEQRLKASSQPVAGGKGWVFLTKAKPTESLATVELKTPAGAVLARLQFDAWK